MKTKPGINPITQQPYEKKSGYKGTFVEGGKVSLDNVLRKRKRPLNAKQMLAKMKREQSLGMY